MSLAEGLWRWLDHLLQRFEERWLKTDGSQR
ncbi:hypothetical protein SAMN06272737_10383 [Blastococcus mobilis]|uniref:Uncharacterized protein n=1 Tax=Blastococcus mobilis TaxID=1938746 RepID=A0A238VHR8_9ACTN|nr:hypothetical protein SAMN06272737_10383 [Blastococcus mobilis]